MPSTQVPADETVCAAIRTSNRDSADPYGLWRLPLRRSATDHPRTNGWRRGVYGRRATVHRAGDLFVPALCDVLPHRPEPRDASSHTRAPLSRSRTSTTCSYRCIASLALSPITVTPVRPPDAHALPKWKGAR